MPSGKPTPAEKASSSLDLLKLVWTMTPRGDRPSRSLSGVIGMLGSRAATVVYSLSVNLSSVCRVDERWFIRLKTKFGTTSKFLSRCLDISKSHIAAPCVLCSLLSTAIFSCLHHSFFVMSLKALELWQVHIVCTSRGIIPSVRLQCCGKCTYKV